MADQIAVKPPIPVLERMNVGKPERERGGRNDGIGR